MDGISGFTNFDDANSCVSGLMTTAKTKKSHAFLMDQTLNENADQAYETARLRRNGVHTTCDRAFARVLAKLEQAVTRCGSWTAMVGLPGKRRHGCAIIWWTFGSMRRLTLRTSKVLDREPPTILFSSEALQANLLRLQNEWETAQTSRDRDAIYQYLNSIFELVSWWDLEGKAVKRAHRALHLRGYSSVREPEPFAAIILCTSDPEKADYRTRSKWSRVLRYVAEYKDLDEPLRDFIQRKGGINECAARFARRLGR